MNKSRLWIVIVGCCLLSGLLLQKVTAQEEHSLEPRTIVLKKNTQDAGNAIKQSSVQTTIPESRLAFKAMELYAPSLERQLSAQGLKLGDPVLLRIFKVPALLEVWVKKGDHFVLFKAYNICQFSGKLGPKMKNGDRQSPEGFYNVPATALNPNSSYYLSFNLGYPNEYDRFHGRTGSLLMVHGECASVGCYAMTNSRISEIYTLMYRAFKNGQKEVQVQAYPFALTDNNMRKMQRHSSYKFWLNLKEGYDIFAKNHKVLTVTVDSTGRYRFKNN